MEKSDVFAQAVSIGALSSQEEKEALWRLADEFIHPGGIAIEIGTWTGGSAVIIGEICKQKGATLLCIDCFSAEMHGLGTGIQGSAFDSVVKNCQGLPIEYMVGDSASLLKYLKHNIADFIFVDGDHHLPKVKQDIEGYWNVLKSGGGYFMHDYGNPCDVKEVVDEFFKDYTLEHADSAVFVRKP